MANLFPPLSIIRKCVSPFHETQSWLTCPATFDSQAVRISIFMSSTIMADMFPPLSPLSWFVFLFRISISKKSTSWLMSVMCSRYFWLSQAVCISISWAAVQSRLTCSRHFCLSGCVFASHKQHNHGWRVPAFFNSQAVRISILFSWLHKGWLVPSIIRMCVTPFYSWHNHGWHAPAAFDSQRVRFSIPWTATCQLTCSCHFLLSVCVYVHFMLVSGTIMVDMLSPLSFHSGCAPSHLKCFRHFWPSASA